MFESDIEKSNKLYSLKKASESKVQNNNLVLPISPMLGESPDLRDNNTGLQPRKLKKFDYYKHMKEKKAREN